jgi:hypothetical protein
MATVFEFFKGKCKFARLQQPDDQYGWGMKFYPDQDSLDRFKSWQAKGIKNELKRDDDGDFFYLRRPYRKERKNGPDIYFTKPVILNKENLPIDTMIGDGSDLIAKAEIYEYKFQNKPGKAMRLAGVKIENLVPYNIPSMSDGEQRLTKDLTEQKAETYGWP